MPADPAIAERLYEHVFGLRDPTGMLVATGKFPDQWVPQYLGLLQIAAAEWRDQPLWPRKLVAAIHFASWYLNLRYDVWRRSTGERLETTERDLASLRSRSEIFLIGGSIESKAE